MDPSDSVYGEFRSAEVDLERWAFAYRNALTLAAESLEADPSDKNILSTSIDLLIELAQLSLILPMPDVAMDPLDVVPIQRLLEALVEVQSGAPVRFLDPRHSDARKKHLSDGRSIRKQGRRFSNLKERRLRAHAVAFVKLLTKTGMKEASAKALVAKVLTEHDLRGRRGGHITRTTVHTWLEDARPSGSRPEEGILATQYERLLSVRTIGSSHSEQIIEWLHERASALALVDG
jgi:hypothetical protein